MRSWNILICGVFFFGLSAFAGEVKHVNAGEAAVLLQQGQKPVVLDVRTAKEYSEAHIEGALNIDFQKSDFEQKVSALDKRQAYLIHCRSGSRSKRSLKIFGKLGFQKIIHLDGGIKAWNKAGGETVK